MKKLMFSAAAVLVVVGSAFAFGARENSSVFCLNAAQTQCNVQTFSLSTVDQGLGVQGTLRCAATPVPVSQCPAITIYKAD